ncbi:MAG: hypothetical protein AAF654_06465 [Myxococcota bacterium]
MRTLALIVGLTLSVGCEDATRRPQIVFNLEADRELGGVATWLRVRLFDQEDQVLLDETVPARDVEIPTVARNDDANRTVRVRGDLFDTLEEPTATDVPISVVEGSARFVAEEVRYVKLSFVRACRDTEMCQDGQTCFRGVCLGACFETTPDQPPLDTAPVCGRCDRCNDAQCTPIDNDTGCGCPGDVCLDGACRGPGPMSGVAGGLSTTCVVRSGQVFCWGSNLYSELGDSSAPSTNRLPVPITLPGPARLVGTNGSEDGTATAHSCALLEGGALYCWGSNDVGQLGLGGAVGDSVPDPSQVTQAPPDIAALDIGGLHTCVRTGDGALWCWGGNFRGQLGVSTPGSNSTNPVQVPSPTGDPWDSHCTGSLHTCGISGGRVYCWGFNSDAQAGVPPSEDIPTPSPIDVEETLAFSSVTCGAFHTCALADDRRAFCWGGNGFGNLGREPAVLDGAPAPVNGTLSFEDLSCGRSHCCALEADGGLWCWGRNTQGQLGVGPETFDRTQPTQTTGPATGWTALALGERHSCAVRDNQFLWCWGRNARGQLGIGDSEERFNPSVVCLP